MSLPIYERLFSWVLKYLFLETWKIQEKHLMQGLIYTLLLVAFFPAKTHVGFLFSPALFPLIINNLCGPYTYSKSSST